MEILTIAIVICAIETMLIGLGGAACFLFRRGGGQRLEGDPPQDIKQFIQQLIKHHEGILRQYEAILGLTGKNGGDLAPALREPEAALRNAIVRLRAVAAQLATEHYTTAGVGRGLLASQEELLAAFVEVMKFAPQTAGPAIPLNSNIPFSGTITEPVLPPPRPDRTDAPEVDPLANVGEPITPDDLASGLAPLMGNEEKSEPITMSDDDLLAEIAALDQPAPAQPAGLRKTVLSEEEIEALMLTGMPGAGNEVSMERPEGTPEADLPKEADFPDFQKLLHHTQTPANAPERERKQDLNDLQAEIEALFSCANQS